MTKFNGVFQTSRTFLGAMGFVIICLYVLDADWHVNIIPAALGAIGAMITRFLYAEPSK